ncbi:MAG: hypothetical protein LBU80_06855, partial [Rikenellaceae bacterium]|nr:hypothetical protein [Rikenellaceae bacterium]
MKTLKTIIITCGAILVSLASCQKEDKLTPDREGDGSVKIQINYPESTRAEGAKVANGVPLTLKAGHIFFTSASGVIDRHIGIETIAGGSPTIGSEQVTIANITAGEAVIDGVSRFATQCYIICGVSTITGNQEGGNISVILANNVTVTDINDATATVNNVPLYGSGEVILGAGTTGGTGTSYGASVDIQLGTPVSRLQIGGITAIPYTSGGGDVTNITSFTVAGIYINNTYTQMPLTSAIPSATYLLNAGQVAANYAISGAGMYVGPAAKLTDQLSGAGATGGTGVPVRPTTGAVWAYNVLPLTIPHVIIHLSSVTYQTG